MTNTVGKTTSWLFGMAKTWISDPGTTVTAVNLIASAGSYVSKNYLPAALQDQAAKALTDLKSAYTDTANSLDAVVSSGSTDSKGQPITPQEPSDLLKHTSSTSESNSAKIGEALENLVGLEAFKQLSGYIETIKGIVSESNQNKMSDSVLKALDDWMSKETRSKIAVMTNVVGSIAANLLLAGPAREGALKLLDQFVFYLTDDSLEKRNQQENNDDFSSWIGANGELVLEERSFSETMLNKTTCVEALLINPEKHAIAEYLKTLHEVDFSPLKATMDHANALHQSLDSMSLDDLGAAIQEIEAASSAVVNLQKQMNKLDVIVKKQKLETKTGAEGALDIDRSLSSLKENVAFLRNFGKELEGKFQERLADNPSEGFLEIDSRDSRRDSAPLIVESDGEIDLSLLEEEIDSIPPSTISKDKVEAASKPGLAR